MTKQQKEDPPLLKHWKIVCLILIILTSLLIYSAIREAKKPLLPEITLSECFLSQPSVPVRPTDKSLASLTGIPELDRIFLCESTNNYLAQNPKSSAWGFCQMIKSTRKYVESQIGKIDWQSPEEQIRACIWLYKNSCPEREWEESKKCWKVLDN